MEIRPRSQRELIALDVERLGDWLRASLFAWTEAHDDEGRVRAFDPLVFDPAVDPARQFANWWSGADPQKHREVEAAIAHLIETIDPGAYADAVRLLLLIGGHLGCERGLGPLYAMLAKPIRLHDQKQEAFANALAFFSANRGSSNELRELAYRLRDLEPALSPIARIEVLSRASVSLGVAVLQDLIELLPDLFEEKKPIDGSHLWELRRFWANTAVDNLGAARAFRFALEAQKRAYPQLREALEEHRLELLPVMRGDAPGERRLRDRVLWRTSHVDLSDFDPKLLSLLGAQAASDCRFAKIDDDERFGLEDFEPEDQDGDTEPGLA